MCLSEDVPLGLCRNVGSRPSQAKRSPYQPSLASQPGANPFCLEHGLILFLSPPTCLVQQYFRFLFGLAWSSCSWLPTGACFGLLLFLPVCWFFWKPPTKYFQEFCVLLLHAFCRPFPWARVSTYVFFVCCCFVYSARAQLLRVGQDCPRSHLLLPIDRHLDANLFGSLLP